MRLLWQCAIAHRSLSAAACKSPIVLHVARGSAQVLTRTMQTASNNCHSTVLWMSPELATGASYSSSSDVWSVGCTVLEMLTAELPYAERKFANPYQCIYFIGSGGKPCIPEDISEHAKHFLQQCFIRCVCRHSHLACAAARLMVRVMLIASSCYVH